jgi:hypothetical protein
LGKGFTSNGNRDWTTHDIYEYDIDSWGRQHPHVILLSYQSHIGHEKSIMRGELAPLITAMRNRAHERQMVDIGEDVEFEDEEDQNEALFPEKSQRVFQYERDFRYVLYLLVSHTFTKA